MKLKLTEDQYSQIMSLIKKHQHPDYSTIHSPKLVIDSAGVYEIEQELKKAVVR